MNPFFKTGVLATAALLLCASAGAAPVTATAPASASAADTQAGKAINKLVDEYYDAYARFEPVWATESGDGRFDGQLGLPIARKTATPSLRCTAAT